MTAVDRKGADHYLPRHGDLSYAADRYELELDYRLATNRLSGRARIVAEARTDLDRFSLDLRGLHVSKITVNGRPAKHVHQHGRVNVTPAARIKRGADFTVVVAYAGNPRSVRGPVGRTGWEELTDGVIVAAQPHGAPSWFPCNDRPSNKASYRISITTAAAYTVVANGELVGRRKSPRGTTWEYEQAEPMATYLATIQIGRYDLEVVPRSGVPLRLAYPHGKARAVHGAFARQGDMIDTFAKLFGRYPFSGYSVVITDDALDIPIEAQSLSIFGSNFLGTGWECERLIAHELAHQWFGNSLTVGNWRDIWLHEGFACYAEWLWSEASGRSSAAHHAIHQWRRVAALPQDLCIGDPGARDMFDDRVYKRGALTLHALREALGDKPFFDLVRAWTASKAHGSVSTEEFVAFAGAHAGRSMDRLFEEWLFRTRLPAFPR